jgi:3-oxoacyl-[acyl-carrier-protein] synthase-1/3-oxoacyl-[acyl-carrier-protein] synthase II
MFRGERAPHPPRRFASAQPVPYPVFEVPDEALAEDLRPYRGLIRTSILALAVAREALADAGWEAAELRRSRVGVCIGTTVGSANHDVEFYRAYRDGERPGMEPIRRFLRSNPAAVIAREYGLGGPCQTVVNACSSGTDAVGIAASWIRGGLCDVALAGGADEITRVTYNGFISLMITDAAPCRPFDAGRRGLNLGEGAGLLVLESEAVRRGRGRRARAFVLGYGTAADAHHLTAPHPEGRGLRRAIADALAESGLAPERLAFVNAHGTATPENDRVESRVLADRLPGVPFGSTKCFTGHTLGAAGAIEAAFSVACLERGAIPATVGFAAPDPELPARPSASPRTVEGDAALSQSLAFGGNNAVIILGRGAP